MGSKGDLGVRDSDAVYVRISVKTAKGLLQSLAAEGAVAEETRQAVMLALTRSLRPNAGGKKKGGGNADASKKEGGAVSNGRVVIPHGRPKDVNLIPGAERGTLTYGLFKARLQGRDVFFTVTDASDESVADLFGAITSNVLKDAPDSACEMDVIATRQGDSGPISLEFQQDPGFVGRTGTITNATNATPIVVASASHGLKDNDQVFVSGVNGNAAANGVYRIEDVQADRFSLKDSQGSGSYTDGGTWSTGPQGNPDYSPLKRFEVNVGGRQKTVTINAPLVHWGDKPGQQMIEDAGGCDARIRDIAPSPNWVGGGPSGCNPTETALERYKGGQALEIDLGNRALTIKLHKGTFTNTGVYPYYTVFEASASPPAGFMGVIHAPKLSNLGRGVPDTFVQTLRQFANGMVFQGGGPNRFQAGIVPFTGGAINYTPMWHITWLFFNCDEVIPPGESPLLESENISTGGQPSPGSGIPGFDPAKPEEFDPFHMKAGIKGKACPAYARRVTNNVLGLDPREGIVYLETFQRMLDSNILFETEAPPGRKLGTGTPLVVNCPLPITVDLRTPNGKKNGGKK